MKTIKQLAATLWPNKTPHGDDRAASPEWWPDAVRVRPRSLTCGSGESAVLVVVGYPAELGPAWLEPLLSWPGRLDVSLHAEPVHGEVALMRLRKRRARLESARRGAASDGRLDDPRVEAAADDAADLSARIARGQSRLFKLALYLTVHAPTPGELDAAISQVRSITSSLLLDARSATFRQLPGLISTLPVAQDLLGAARTVDTDTIAASFPFASPDPPLPDNGVLYGVNLLTGSPLVHDRWAQDNHNSVVVARSGAGKSFLAKTEVLRHLYDGTQCTVIDPDGEYVDLAHHVGGSVIEAGKPDVHLNPLDIPAHTGDDTVDALTRRVMFTGTYAATCLGRDLDAGEHAALDAAVLAAYADAGITADARTWTRTPPTLADVDTHLTTDTEGAGARLSAMLRPYIHGGFSNLTKDRTTTSLNGHLVVVTLRHLPDELAPAATVLILDAIWARLTGRCRRLVYVDEAWLLLQHGPGAAWLARMAKTARKRRAGLTVITQDAADLLSGDLGRVVIANSTTQVLMRLAPQTATAVAEAFNLTAAETDLLRNARQGDGLLLTGESHAAFASCASDAEMPLLVTGEAAAGGDPA